ncbi:probable serine carboxypeptidase CPVL [Biomphalaria glabrata]|uniref:Probable serine carboxypeptidase CPVL n=1 Tax=Biomphalaria glabrata TaxID=6526 RepID=A0A9U8ECC2_BIOGL|nr:probable serine carboxypeptidase CPVL [Biomphalaria glabrata]
MSWMIKVSSFCLCTFLPLLLAEPLFLTPYIESGRIQEAQRDSLVNSSKSLSSLLPKGSHAGFITVNKTLGNHLFFWFFPCLENTSAPLLVWLNGGPGVSSMFGLLWENGPIEISSEDDICKYKPRKHSWTKSFSMLYIDNPVNVGYSFSESGPAGERLTQDSVSKDLYSFMEQFYSLFPDYKKRELYIGGQSYAGKYVPYLAHVIHTQRKANASDIPLAGIYIGGPFFDPPTQSPAFFYYLYSMGAISHEQMLFHQKTVENLFRDYKNGQLKITNLSHIFTTLVPRLGFDSKDNYLSNVRPRYDKAWKFMNTAEVREAVHVGIRKFRVINENIFDRFSSDIFVSAKDKVSALLEHYKVLIFTGDSDVIVSTYMVDTALMSTPWSKQAEFIASSRTPWWSVSQTGPELKGFYTSVGQLCRVVVRKAGHQTPHDQPEATLEMMQQFVNYGCLKGDIKVPRQRYHRVLKNCSGIENSGSSNGSTIQATKRCTLPIL